MENLLRQHNWFRECLLLGVNWLHEGFRVQLVFNYIWKESGVVRENLDEELPVAVSFEAVREFHVRNTWNQAMLAHPDKLNWGVSEVVQIEVEDDPDRLRPFEEGGHAIRHVTVLWEDERRIDVVCSGLEVHEL